MTEKNSFFTESVEAIASQLHTDPLSGLTSEEAQRRLAQNGPNEIQEGEQTTLWQKFIDQFKDAMIVILLISAALSILLEGIHGLVDASIILVVVLLNAILGVLQETKAEDAIASLKDMSSPKAHVIRDGESVIIDSRQIVVGDVVVLEAGDVVPADLRLTSVHSLKIEEAALTGESVPVEKNLEKVNSDASLGDRRNMAFSSTNVTYGRGQGIVVATAMSTEVGHIATMIQNSEEKITPLKANMNQLTKFLTWAIVVIAAIIFFIGLFTGLYSWIEMLLVAISIAVAALPEGLPAISTIILALGTQKMADRNALVRKLPAVETLGGTEVICSDKTGTLTQNKMTIEKLFYNGHFHEASEEVDFSEPLFQVMLLDNDSTLTADLTLTGDPTETAMIQLAIDKGYDVKGLREGTPRLGEIPFDSERKMSTTVHQNKNASSFGNSPYVILTKGAPDVLINNCTSYFENGEIHPMTEDYRQMLLDQNDQMARQALRVLAMSFKPLEATEDHYTTESHEHQLVYAGMVGEIDPERPEVKDAIATAKSAGIRTVMITGDHQITAAAIAERLGIIDQDNIETGVTTGAYLDTISDEQLENEVEQYSVYARVAPEHKVRIVKAWQSAKHNKVVAMTGDGVNDAPSLKQADIGVGMGITGTEVSKGASDMVLADDNFATIVTAVKEGRKVFSNIQKAVQYLLSANLGEVMTLFVATIMGWQILEPIHILWINLVTDTFPAIALGVEDAEADVMEHLPRGRKTNILSGGLLPALFYQGIYEGGITLFVYWFSHYYMNFSNSDAEAIAFLTLSFIQLAHAYNSRSVHKSLFSSNPFANKWLNYATIISSLLLLITVFLPGLNAAFGTIHLVGDPEAFTMWAIILLASLSIILYVEIVKFFLRKSGYADKVENHRS